MARGRPVGSGNTGGASKMDLVRQALADLPDGSPKELQAHIKQHAGVDMKTLMISSYKSQLRRKGADGADASIALNDLTAIQRLIEKVGAPQLQQLIKVLAK